jgi:hypothetical protein
MILRRLLAEAARRLAADPKVQAKAADVYQTEIRPRAKTVARDTRANYDFARSELADIAHETDPLKDPKGFLLKAKKRLYDLP